MEKNISIFPYLCKLILKVISLHSIFCIKQNSLAVCRFSVLIFSRSSISVVKSLPVIFWASVQSQEVENQFYNFARVKKTFHRNSYKTVVYSKN